MTYYHPLIALEIVRQHTQALDDEACNNRLANQAREARRSARPARTGGVRPAIVSVLRAVSSAADGLANATCRAATRLEGRTA